MAAGQQVPVHVEGGLDLGMTHELLDRPWVRSRVDQQRGEGVATLVQRDAVGDRRGQGRGGLSHPRAPRSTSIAWR